jgi:hypothetical protein
MFRLASKTLHSGLAILISLWVAGAGCMFGCGEMFAAPSELPRAESAKLATIVSGDACAAHGSHDCCVRKKVEASPATNRTKKHQATARLELLLTGREALNPTSSTGTGECPLALSRAIAISKVGDRKDLVVTTVAVQPLTIPTSSEFTETVRPAARLPNGCRTYLRCCSFLI